jgi:hypothetical protein
LCMFSVWLVCEALMIHKSFSFLFLHACCHIPIFGSFAIFQIHFFSQCRDSPVVHSRCDASLQGTRWRRQGQHSSGLCVVNAYLLVWNVSPQTRLAVSFVSSASFPSSSRQLIFVCFFIRFTWWSFVCAKSPPTFSSPSTRLRTFHHNLRALKLAIKSPPTKIRTWR